MQAQPDLAPTAYIFLNGDFDPPWPNWPQRPSAHDLVIAADGGGRHPLGLGWPVHYLVGDFDSLDPTIMDQMVALGAIVERHPVHKDEIDFELALRLARRRGYEAIVVLGALGGRWDMTLGNLFLPMAAGWGCESILFRHGPWNFRIISGPAELAITGQAGDRLSLLPLGGEAQGLTLSGCRYPLTDETLPAGLSRGLSNELMISEAELKIESGSLLVIHQNGSVTIQP